MSVFPIAPAESRYLWFIIPVVVLLLGGVAILVISVRGARASRFEIRADGLRLQGDLYGRFVPKGLLRLDGARRVDLAREQGLQPRSRRMGTALPGYQAGWFRLRNGEKALLYLTDRARAVYIPTSAGYSLLMSPADPDSFLSRLREVLGS
ncbi:MAG TPA: PH domain-containing protein [Gemmatimonadales bacterium]|nr:PH domain-containing protein [Gemmatimonadales bacterium]